MHDPTDACREEQGFRWSPWWALGPGLVALVLGALVVFTAGDLDQQRGRDARGVAGGAALAGPPAPSADWPPVQEDLGTLETYPDLRAAAAARRLWARGRSEAIVQALQRPATTPGLRLQLLAIAASDPPEEIRSIARRLLEEGALDRKTSALCRMILGEEK